MPKDSLTFTIQIPVKPYVKKFIEANFGSPADFSSSDAEWRYLRFLLKQRSKRNECKFKDFSSPYPDILEVLILEDDFYRHGWELTKTDAVSFGKYFENNVKFFMRTFVGVYVALGLPIFKAIEKFRVTFDFNEDDWKYDTLKKDYYRHGSDTKLDFNIEIFNKIETIILAKMSDRGTISQSIIKQHENNSKTEG